MKLRKLPGKIKRAGEEIRTYGGLYLGERFLYRMSKRISPNRVVTYTQWAKGHVLTPAQAASQRKVWSERDRNAAPCFLVVLETEGESEERISRTKLSLKEQTYLPDKVFLGTRDRMPERVREYLIENNKQAQTWILRIPAGDVLEPDFFYHCFKALEKDGAEAIWYTDHEQWRDEKGRPEERRTCFKPDFSEDYLCAYPYIGNSFIAKAALYGENLEKLTLDTYCLLLEWTKEGMCFGHIPRKLYVEKSYDCSGTKTDIEQTKYLESEREKRIIQIYQDQGIRSPENVRLVPGPSGTRQVRLSWGEYPLVSVLIPNKDHAEDLFTCLKSLQKQTVADRMELIIMENNSEHAQTYAFYQWLETGEANVHLPEHLMDETLREQFSGRIRVLCWEGEFNYSAINNFGAKEANGEFLLLLNNDIELIYADGIEHMLEVGMPERVGIVGAKLYYEDETVQHAGVVVGLGGVAGHAFVGIPMDDSGYMCQADCLRRVSAVTAACLLVKTEVYRAVGGLNEKLAVAFNDVDFCLKVCALGKQILYQPACEAWHFESKSRGADTEGEKLLRFQQEIFTFQEIWKDFLEKGDPYYNVNLTLDRNDYSYRDPYFQYAE